MFTEENDDYFANLPEEQVHEALKPPPPWPVDYYDATIVSAERYQKDEDSYPCVKVTVNVVNSEGKTKKLSKWVLSKSPGAALGGIRFLKSVGLKNTEYRNPAQLVGLSTRVKLTQKTGTDGVDRNEIDGFYYRR